MKKQNFENFKVLKAEVIKETHNIYFIFKNMSERKLWTPEVTFP